MSNLAIRTLVAVVAIPLILAACFYGGFFFFLFTTILIVLGTNEFYMLSRAKNFEPLAVFGITGAATLNALVYSSPIPIAYEFITALILFALLLELFKKRTDGVKGTFENVGVTITGIVYVGYFGSILTAIRERVGIQNVLPTHRSAGLFIISIFAMIWICDSAAYFVGGAIGRHKMSKFVSPKKSWEGAIAGFVFALLTSAGCKYWVLPQLSWHVMLATGLIIGTFGQAGDFVESLFKRDACAKDSSDMIPGHGGVLDRFDSLLFSAPLIYMMLQHLR